MRYSSILGCFKCTIFNVIYDVNAFTKDKEPTNMFSVSNGNNLMHEVHLFYSVKLKKAILVFLSFSTRSHMKYISKACITVLFLGLMCTVWAQQPKANAPKKSSGTSVAAGKVSNIKKATSITDTGAVDTSHRDTANMKKVKVKTATGLDSEIKYNAEDSIKFSVDGKIIYLYGKGRIYYEDLELDADYITIDQASKTLFARGRYDKYKVYRGRPIFKQGQDKPVTTDSVVFNFDSKKGKAFGTATSDDQGYIQASQFKKNEFNEGFLKDGIYSTCNLPEPYTHFGIHIDKGIVTEKQVLAKNAYLEIEHIPIYFAYLPFGFFPKTNKRASGFRFPTFGEDATRGFFMQGIGWYLGINDYWDADITGTLYSKGSYNINTAARYRKNYKYNGSVNIAYASIKDANAVEGTSNNRASKQFNIQWTHTQDQAAHPGVTFGASVNFGTSRYFTTMPGGSNPYNYDNLTRNNMSSSINYGRTFLDGLFNFTTSLNHRQDITDRTVSLTFPSFNLSMMTINPFDSKNRVGEQKWYQRIALGYSVQGNNSYNGPESEVFKKETLKKFNTSVQHAVPLSLSLNVLKVLQFNTSVNYQEAWTFQSLRKTYDPTLTSQIRTDTLQGFARNYNYSFSGGFSTKVFGKVQFKKGNLVALRHVMTPTVSFNYSPDFTSNSFGFYKQIGNLPQNQLGGVRDYKTVYDSIKQVLGTTNYSRFMTGGGGTRQQSISFSLDNTIEAKLRSKSDTSDATRNVPILQGLRFSGSYNFAADSLKLSVISFSGRTAFFNQKVGLNFSGSFDPYQVERDALGNPRRINKFLLSKGSLARLASLSFSTDFSFNSAALKARNEELRKRQNNPSISPIENEEIRSILMNPNYYVDFTVPWNFSASYQFNYINNGLNSTVTNTLNFNGDLSVTPKWKIQFNSGYDFKANKISMTRFSINRDLHCWDMAIGWVPFGTYRSYSIDIRVRASILQDLKLSRRSASINPF